MTTTINRSRHPTPPLLTDGFAFHGIREQVTVKGTLIPGLRATFYRRPNGQQIETIGLYSVDAHDLFVAWGYVGEPHCRYNAVRHGGQDHDGDGWSFYATRRGCPVLEPLRELGGIAGVTVLADRVLVPFRFADLSAGRAGNPLDGDPDGQRSATEL
jgi:hypothetical protein